MSEETVLNILERANDEALVRYWRAVLTVRECETALDATRESLALREAQWERDKAQEAMSVARLAYLEEKVKEAR